jgi:hypothetical protein
MQISANATANDPERIIQLTTLGPVRMKHTTIRIQQTTSKISIM